MKRFLRSLTAWINRYSLKILLTWIIILSILYSLLSILRHNHFQSGGFDLGLYDQAAWQFSQFLTPYNTVKERFIFGDHLVLTLPVFGLLFYLWDNVRVLLIAQAVVITFSALPIYFIAKKRLASALSAVGLAILYSLFYGIQYGVYFDFHPIIVGVALLSWLAYFWEFGKTRLFWITLGLALFTQENMGIAVAGLSAIFFFRREFRRKAILVGLIGIFYSLLAARVVAQFSPVGYQYWPQLPKHPIDAITRLFDSEEKRLVWLYSYSTLSFLPLFSIGSVIAVLMDLSQYFVTGPEFSRMWSPFMHHRAILAPLLILGAVDGLVFFKKRRVPVTHVVLGMMVVGLGLQYYYHFPLNKLAKAEYWKEEAWMENTRELISLVPADASVATQQNLVPHLSHRKEIYLLWPRQHDITDEPCGQSLCWWLDFGGKPEYLVVDTRPNQWLTQTLESNENWLSAIGNMEKVGRIILFNRVGDAKLYRIVWK